MSDELDLRTIRQRYFKRAGFERRFVKDLRRVTGTSHKAAVPLLSE
jgi:hypothetical protein